MAEPARRPPRSLRGRLALWIGLSTAASLLVFAVVAYLASRAVETEQGEAGAEAESPAVSREEVMIAMAFAAPVGLILATAGALWLTRRALAPVDRVIEAAGSIGADRLDRRLPVPARDDELRDLVVALNGLLDRLEGGYAALDTFAADASHELRTPLAVIGSELEVALRRPRSAAEWETSARTSLDELRRLGRLVDALLRLARAGTGRPVADQSVDLVAVVAQVVAAQRGAAAAAEIALDDTLAAGPAVISGDADAIDCAVGNLLGNAIRYTPRGGRVSVALAVAGGRASVEVADTGPGLDAGEVDSVFEPFTRGHQGRAADQRGDGPPGLGLGLTLARRIAERHGGRLTAGAGDGGGARFVLELPLA